MTIWTLSWLTKKDIWTPNVILCVLKQSVRLFFRWHCEIKRQIHSNPSRSNLPKMIYPFQNVEIEDILKILWQKAKLLNVNSIQQNSFFRDFQYFCQDVFKIVYFKFAISGKYWTKRRHLIIVDIMVQITKTKKYK